MSQKLIELNWTQGQGVVFLLVMTLTGKDGNVWIQKQRKLMFPVTWCLMKFHHFKLTPIEAQLISHPFPDGASREKGSNITPTEENIQQEETTRTVLRSTSRQRRQPDYLADYDCSVVSYFFTRGSCEDEPTSYNEAKGISEWEEAMQEEISALNKNCTWELVPKPKNVTPVTCKWVYKLKKRVDGTIDWYKARLVARGFSQ